jgi:hypothetical protein
MVRSHLYTIVKTIGYRAISWADTCFLVWLILGTTKIPTAQAIVVFGTVDMLINTFIYFWYDRLYMYIESLSLEHEYLPRSIHIKKTWIALILWGLVGPIMFTLTCLVVYLYLY